MNSKKKKGLFGLKPFVYYSTGRDLLNDPLYQEVQRRTFHEKSKIPRRTDIINHIMSTRRGKTSYLEIGVAAPRNNFDHIRADVKFSVDPGVEYKENPVDFKMTSDDFFRKLSDGEILTRDFRFDVVFIDGLHLAQQVDKDIRNALTFLKEDGFIVLHDCNPCSEWHARETYRYHMTPAGKAWTGTTWKAFLKWRTEPSLQSCCIDTDWGVGVLSKRHKIGMSIEAINPFFEYQVLEQNRKEYLNLVDFETFKESLKE
jgi:hypothetical protein